MLNPLIVTVYEPACNDPNEYWPLASVVADAELAPASVTWTFGMLTPSALTVPEIDALAAGWHVKWAVAARDELDMVTDWVVVAQVTPEGKLLIVTMYEPIGTFENE